MSVPCACERVGLREHIDQEGRYLLRAIALLRRRIARQLDAVVLPQRDAGDQRETQECRRDRRHRQQVAAQNLAVL